MSLAARFGPYRSLVFPFVLVLFPLLWFVNREVGIATATTSRPGTEIRLAAVESTVVAVAVSLVAAIVVVAVLRLASVDVPSRARPFFLPSSGTLAVFTGLSLAFWAAAAFELPRALPAWGYLLFELLFLWPLVAVHTGMIVVGNALVGEPSLAVQSVVVGVGVALSTAWLFLLSRWIAAIAIPGDSGVVSG